MAEANMPFNTTFMQGAKKKSGEPREDRRRKQTAWSILL